MAKKSESERSKPNSLLLAVSLARTNRGMGRPRTSPWLFVAIVVILVLIAALYLLLEATADGKVSSAHSFSDRSCVAAGYLYLAH